MTYDKNKAAAPKFNRNRHYLGHRSRVRENFLEKRKHLGDYEILEMLLFFAIPRRDTKPIAKELMNRFGTLENVINAEEESFLDIPGVGGGALALIKLAQEIHLRILKGRLEKKIGTPHGGGRKRVRLDGLKIARDYCLSAMSSLLGEEFLVIFVNENRSIVREETLGVGNIGEVAVHIGMLMVKAVTNRAAAVILAHNHPGGMPEPSPDDLVATDNIGSSLEKIGISLWDHIIVSGENAFSFRENGLL